MCVCVHLSLLSRHPFVLDSVQKRWEMRPAIMLLLIYVTNLELWLIWNDFFFHWKYALHLNEKENVKQLGVESLRTSTSRPQKGELYSLQKFLVLSHR